MFEKQRLFKRPSSIFVAALSLMLATAVHAEEKSLWQKFKDFFNPSTSVEGEGPEYDELRSLDEQISKLEGKYSRERRPGNKERIKKELENLREKRDVLAKQIEEKEKNGPKSSATVTDTQSSASIQSSVSSAVIVHDTVFVRDTVFIHDTLYVIVAGKPDAAGQPANSSASTQPESAAGNNDSSDSTVPDSK